MTCRTLLVLAGFAAVTATAAGPADAPKILLAQGLVLTTTTHAGLNTTEGSLPIADVETVYSVDRIDADKIWFAYTVGAPGDAKAGALLGSATRYVRVVRTEDLRTATRLNALFSSADPQVFPGQTFLQASTAVLTALKTTGETPFVFGINEQDRAHATLGSLLGSAAQPAASNTGSGRPLDLSPILALLAADRHYFRGSLKRVEPGSVKFPVLLDGVRTDVPAIHARGVLKFADRTMEVNFWWLDDPANALTLKWTAADVNAVLTRIDTPQPEQRSPGAGAGTVGAALASRNCRAEMRGVYFASGSAALLQESEAALRQVAVALAANPSWQVTIEGHTDNIGSPAYNSELSLHRANAVRSALVERFRISASHIDAQGFGLARPIESNATPEGRARNRRVELARKCT